MSDEKWTDLESAIANRVTRRSALRWAARTAFAMASVAAGLGVRGHGPCLLGPVAPSGGSRSELQPSFFQHKIQRGEEGTRGHRAAVATAMGMLPAGDGERDQIAIEVGLADQVDYR